MTREIKRRTRDRYLTPEEAAKCRTIREQIEQEKPEINARIKAQLEAASSVQRVFKQLKQVREAKGPGPARYSGLDGNRRLGPLQT